MDRTYIPAQAPIDSVMASASEVAAVREWVLNALTGHADSASDRIGMKVIRQDHNTLHYRQSCMETPITLGAKRYQRGLGTHAHSIIDVTLPDGARRFQADVGVDNNYDTAGIRGTVRFALETGGRRIWQSPVLKSGMPPHPVDVELPADAAAVTLVVDPTEDGAGWDQADWADARIILRDGSVRWLDEGYDNALLQGAAPPFGFLYDGVPVQTLLSNWRHTATTVDKGAWLQINARWDDPATGLQVQVDARCWRDYPAVDWLVRLTNRGQADTPLIESLQAADMPLNTGNSRTPMTWHRLLGDSVSARTFLPDPVLIEPGRTEKYAPQRGRPSQETAFPFWNVQYGDQGLITAIGWSGQWSAEYSRTDAGATRFRAGMETTRLRLHPGESIRTPRVLLMAWQGSRVNAQNRFRRLMLHHYVPQVESKPLRLPIALQPFDRYWQRPGWPAEQAQLEAAEAAHTLGCDTYWFDAAWFPGMFPNGVGNWEHKPDDFPRGLKPIADRLHQYGMQFILWFEPCRVAEGSRIAREHPEYVHGGSKGGLYKLDDPAALAFLTDLISRRIAEYDLDVYREDFNIDPLPFWQMADAPDRQGITEIRFVEGHYAFWDALRARKPGLWIDNCASGGRRIDLETCMRSVPLWRSDTSCWAGHPEWNQMQSMALAQYIPLFTASAWDSEPYVFRSSATGGLICELGYLEAGFDPARVRQLLDEVKANRAAWYGDYYPLSPINTELDQFTAWQLHRPDLQSGIVLAFRRPQSATRGLVVDLAGIDPKRRYRLELVDEALKRRVRTVSGASLITNGLTISIAQPGESLLVRYRAVP